MDGELAMPALSHSLRLTAIAPRASRSIARLILVVLTLCVAGWSTAQAPAPQPRADQEPITPIPLPPVQDPRQVALGDRLFHDARLSHGNTRSCNSCHDTSTNGASVSPPDSTAGTIELNIPTVFNAALSFRLKWEGDLRTLEGQIEETLCKPQTMGSSVEEALHKLQADPDVARQFREAFGREADGSGLVGAIAAYERTLLTPGSRFDRWLGGDVNAITAEGVRRLPVVQVPRLRLLPSRCQCGRQHVPAARNISSTCLSQARDPSCPELAERRGHAAVFHDGSAATLSRAVQQMGYAQLDRKLTDDQTKAIVAFLNTLTGTYLGKPITPAGQLRQSDAPK
jgi:cytochrome c peroxidase